MNLCTKQMNNKVIETINKPTCIPPSVLILVRSVMSDAGTQAGVQKHSPVLDPNIQTAQG
jgi:hypothetical protein